MSTCRLLLLILCVAGLGAPAPAFAAPSARPAGSAPDTEPVEALYARAKALADQQTAAAHREALPLLRRAAQRKHGPATLLLGRLLGKPDAGVYDRVEALRWLRPLADADQPEAWHALAEALAEGASVRDAEEAISLWERAAAVGHGGAMRSLAFWTATPWKAGLPADPVRATRWIATLADRGDSHYQALYAERLLDGIGIAPDPRAAIAWYEKAAGQQHPAATLALGQLLLAPPAGVTRDPARAVRWLRAAAALRDGDAWLQLGRLTETGEGVAPDPAEARRCYRQAVDAGNMEAPEQLGRLLEQGLGGPADAAEAYKWYRIGFTEGAKEGAERLRATLSEDKRVAAEQAAEAYRAWQAQQP